MAARNWMFTINNPDDTDDPNAWEVKYVVWQLEEGESGTPHYQGYVELEKVSRLAAMKKLSLKAHWEKRMGTRWAWAWRTRRRCIGPVVCPNRAV